MIGNITSIDFFPHNINIIKWCIFGNLFSKVIAIFFKIIFFGCFLKKPIRFFFHFQMQILFLLYQNKNQHWEFYFKRYFLFNYFSNNYFYFISLSYSIFLTLKIIQSISEQTTQMILNIYLFLYSTDGKNSYYYAYF